MLGMLGVVRPRVVAPYRRGGLPQDRTRTRGSSASQPSWPRRQPHRALRVSVRAVANKVDKGEGTAFDVSLRSLPGIGKATQAALELHNVGSVTILKEIWSEQMDEDKEAMKAYLTKFDAIRRPQIDAIVNWLAAESPSANGDGNGAQRKPAKSAAASQDDDMDEMVELEPVQVAAEATAPGEPAAAPVEVEAKGAPAAARETATAAAAAPRAPEPPVYEAWEDSLVYSLYRDLCESYNASTPRLELEAFGESLLYEVESRSDKTSAHAKLLDLFYTHNPVLVNAVYLCFLENAADGLNVDHVLSVVELIAQRPHEEELWWFLLTALRMDARALTSDELISLIEEGHAHIENTLTRTEVAEVVFLIRGVEDPQDATIESAEVLLSLLTPSTMYLFFLHQYIAAQDDASAIAVLERMPRSIISTLPLKPPSSDAVPCEGPLPECLQYDSYLEVVLRVRTEEALPQYYAVFLNHGAASMRLFQGFTERALSCQNGGAVQYAALTTLYDTYIDSENEALLKGMSTDMVVRLANHLAEQRQRAAGYDAFFGLVERSLTSPDLDRFRREYMGDAKRGAAAAEVGAKAATMERVELLMRDFGSAYFKKVIQFNPLGADTDAAAAAAAAEGDTNRYMRSKRQMSLTTQHYLEMCLLADSELVYSFTKPFDDYFGQHTDDRAMAAISKFLTRRCGVPAPVVTQLMRNPNFYHPTILEVVQKHKPSEIQNAETLLGATRFLTAIKVMMKLNTINSTDLRDCLKDVSELSQVTSEFDYIFEQLSAKVLDAPETDQLVDNFDCYSYKACMQKMAIAFKNIKFPEGMSQLESIVARLLEKDPISWQGQLDALDTIIFFLNYATAERLDLAYQQFGVLNAARSNVQETISKVKAVYTEPIVPIEESTLLEARLAELKRPSEPGCSDFALVQRITAFVVENMKERLGSHFMPHHTQLITLLSFLESRTLHSGKDGNVIAQVGTGEGKSLIIAMLAAYYVMKGCSRVNVLVDNLSLLERDFSTFDALFRELGISACSAANQQTVEPSVQVCYHTAHSLEVQYLASLNNKGPSAIPEDAVLIVDEVDGLIVDEDLNRAYVYEDKRASRLIAQAMQERTSDLRPLIEPESEVLAEAVAKAEAALAEKVNGKDYTVDNIARKCKILDKYARPREQAYELWLELLNTKTFNTTPRYLSPQFLLSRPHVLKKHSRIVGLSGSLGNDAEQEFVKAVYDCELFLVPPFLDCCRGKKKERPACKGIFVEESPEAHFRKVATIALDVRNSGVPVLVIMKSDDAAEELVTKYLKPMLGEEAIAAGEVLTVSNPLFSESRSKFKDTVNKATTRTSTTDRYRITCTSPIGGRGQDYRVQDDAVDINGGMMLVVGFVPDSEREYIQFLGRTARQDKRGQYCVVLHKADYPPEVFGEDGGAGEAGAEESVANEVEAGAEVDVEAEERASGADAAAAAVSGTTVTTTAAAAAGKEDQTGVIRRILTEGSARTREKLKSQKNVLDKGMLMNEMGERVFQLREEEGFQSDMWVDLVRNYREYTQEQLLERVGEVTKDCSQPQQPAAPAAAAAVASAGAQTNGTQAKAASSTTPDKATANNNGGRRARAGRKQRS